jgi:hypothetical protein
MTRIPAVTTRKTTRTDSDLSLLSRFLEEDFISFDLDTSAGLISGLISVAKILWAFYA